MKIENIDSKIVLTKNLFEETFQKLTYLGKVLPNLSFYLVNEKTMDQLCPPRKGYNEECLEFLENIEELRNLEKSRYEKYERYENNYENTIEIIESIYKKLERCKTKDYVAYACYKKSSIYLCPERIKSDKLFPFILIHELVHAYLDTKRKVYNEIIEESIANAIALLHYKNYEVFEFIDSQPAEYKGCYFWITSFNESILPYILDHLRVGKLFPLELENFELFGRILEKPLIYWFSAFYFDILKDLSNSSEFINLENFKTILKSFKMEETQEELFHIKAEYDINKNTTIITAYIGKIKYTKQIRGLSKKIFESFRFTENTIYNTWYYNNFEEFKVILNELVQNIINDEIINEVLKLILKIKESFQISIFGKIYEVDLINNIRVIIYDSILDECYEIDHNIMYIQIEKYKFEIIANYRHNYNGDRAKILCLAGEYNKIQEILERIQKVSLSSEDMKINLRYVYDICKSDVFEERKKRYFIKYKSKYKNIFEDLIYKSYIYYIEKGDISIFYKALGIYILKYVKNI